MIGDLPLYNADQDGVPAVARLRAEIESADGLFFVTPEYNFSIPGVLKNAIDWASRPSPMPRRSKASAAWSCRSPAARSAACVRRRI